MPDPLSENFNRSMETFRRRAQNAIHEGRCVVCEQPATWYSQAGKREYAISGTCEPCFDRMFAEPEGD